MQHTTRSSTIFCVFPPLLIFFFKRKQCFSQLKIQIFLIWAIEIFNVVYLCLYWGPRKKVHTFFLSPFFFILICRYPKSLNEHSSKSTDVQKLPITPFDPENFSAYIYHCEKNNLSVLCNVLFVAYFSLLKPSHFTDISE